MLEAPMLVFEYDIHGQSLTGETIYRSVKHNLVTEIGRGVVAGLLFGLIAASSLVLAAGSGPTAANVLDTQLEYELIGNPTRKTLTDNNGDPLAWPASVIDETNTIGPNTFYRKVIVKGFYDASDGNNNSPFREYALFNKSSTPPTPTTDKWGDIINHLVDTADFNKTASNTLTVTITFYF